MKNYRLAFCIAGAFSALLIFVASPLALFLVLLAVACSVIGFVVYTVLFDDDIGMLCGADSAGREK